MGNTDLKFLPLFDHYLQLVKKPINKLYTLNVSIIFICCITLDFLVNFFQFSREIISIPQYFGVVLQDGGSAKVSEDCEQSLHRFSVID